MRRREEVEMGRLLIAAAILPAAILLSSSTGFAQVPAPSTGSAMNGSSLTAMGDTSAPPPPGANAAAAALDGAGVPLGATDLFVGGLSPSPTDLGGGCPSAASVVTLGTGAIFSGDGTLSMSPSDLGGATTPSGSDCSTAPTAGVGPLGLSSATGAAAAFGGGRIPLAATALPTTGLASPIPVPGSITPCTSTGGSVVAASPLGNPMLGLAPSTGALSSGTGLAC